MPEKASYYQHCGANDLVALAEPLLRLGYRIDHDGKFKIDTSVSWDHPWHHVKHTGELDCGIWHKVMFDVVFQKRWVPSPCHECWKVVVRPPTVLGLFALLELQKRLGRPSKCGIEKRDYVCGLYGGYFYNRSLGAGQECWQAVRTEVDQDPNLGPQVPVILKRGCTEFEMACGPSDKWEIAPEQLAVEALVNEHFEHDLRPQVQPDHVLAHIHAEWIRWAHQNGDLTYLNFTNGEPLYKPYVTYHPVAEPPPKAA